MGRLKRLGVPFALVLVGALVTGAVAWGNCPDNPVEWLKPYCQELDAEQACPGETRVAIASKRVSKEEDGSYEREWNVAKARAESYRGGVGTLRTILWLQALFLLFALVLLLRDADEQSPLEVPLLKIQIPVAWCHLIVPIVLTYLYIWFGFTLDHLIQERYLLWLQFEQLEAPRGSRSIHSMRMLIEDRWLMDSWFAEFHTKAIAMPAESGGVVALNRFLLGLFALFIGIQHGVSFFLLSRKEFPGGQDGNRGTGWACVTLVVMILVLGFVHVGFMVFGGNPNWVQPWVGVFAVVTMLLLTLRYPHGWGTPASEVEQEKVAVDWAEKARTARERGTQRKTERAVAEARLLEAQADAAKRVAEAAERAANAIAGHAAENRTIDAGDARDG